MKKEEQLRALEMKEKFKIAMNTIIDEEFDLLLAEVEAGRYTVKEGNIDEIFETYFGEGKIFYK